MLLKVRSYKSEGIIIKRVNFGEADRILTIFTKHDGKLRVIANGVRKITSKRGGSLEIFNKIIAYIYTGKNLDSLNEVEVKESFLNLRKNLKKVSLGYYLCELVDGLCPEKQVHKEVFDLLERALAILNGQIQNNSYSVKQFEIELLQELGYLSKNKDYLKTDTTEIIENLLQKRVKSKHFIRLVLDKK